MRVRILTVVGGLLLIGGSVAAALLVEGAERHVVKPEIPGTPYIDVISPRDGFKPRGNSVVAKVKVHNFTLAPAQFGQTPQLGQGMLRFSLNKVPDEVDESEEEEAESNPLGSGRVIGRSFDCPHYAGPNGILAKRLGSVGQFAPATRPQIYYRNLPEGLFRLVITLAQNDGSPTPYHTVTHFRVEERPPHGPPTGVPCVPS
ncbi:MAG: hypothetical protein ACRDKV_02725 [Solirubrobacterales bacterium]